MENNITKIANKLGEKWFEIVSSIENLPYEQQVEVIDYSMHVFNTFIIPRIEEAKQ